jgi:hypothetical protein
MPSVQKIDLSVNCYDGWEALYINKKFFRELDGDYKIEASFVHESGVSSKKKVNMVTFRKGEGKVVKVLETYCARFHFFKRYKGVFVSNRRSAFTKGVLTIKFTPLFTFDEFTERLANVEQRLEEISLQPDMPAYLEAKEHFETLQLSFQKKDEIS